MKHGSRPSYLALAIALLPGLVALWTTAGCSSPFDHDEALSPIVLIAPEDGLSIMTPAPDSPFSVPAPNDRLIWTGGTAPFRVEAFDVGSPAAPVYLSPPSAELSCNIADLQLYDTASSTYRLLGDYLVSTCTIEWRVLDAAGQVSAARRFSLARSASE